MEVSGIAIGQWNQICRKKEGIRRTTYKINRAIAMGDMAYIYKSKDYIIRYQDLNILISRTGIALVVWRDNETDPFEISERKKKLFDAKNTHKLCLRKANIKHSSVMSMQKSVDETIQIRGNNNDQESN